MTTIPAALSRGRRGKEMREMKLRAFRQGETIPDGSRYIRSENREIPGSEYEKVVEPRSLLSWLGITETVATMVKVETVDVYEVPE